MKKAMRCNLIIMTMIFLAMASSASATILVYEDFESRAPGDRLRIEFGPNWDSTTNAFQVGNVAGFAAEGIQYLSAPSRFGAGELTRFGWYDASTAFNARPAGQDIVLASVKMYVPNVVESTFGGMWMFDQAFNTIAIIGVDMLTGKTLSSATDRVNNIAVNLGQYNDIEVVANFNTGLIEYLINDILIGEKMMTAGNMASGFSDFDFYNNGFDAGSSVPFRYDNYKVEVVPEPTVMLLFWTGLAGLGLFRKRFSS